MIRLLALILALTLPISASADPYPQPQTTDVNDFANLLSLERRVELRNTINALRRDTGIELTIVTLQTRADFDPSPSLDDFTLRLFNGWGVGNATRNDGILILVVPQEREMRIQLGSAYHQGYDVTAQDVIRLDFRPAFRDGDYEAGIVQGTNAVITRIARAHAKNLPPVATREPMRQTKVLSTLIIFVLIPGLILFKLCKKYLTRCQNCGRRGLTKTRQTRVRPTRTMSGEARVISLCRHCGWQKEDIVILTRRGGSDNDHDSGGSSSSGSSGGSFGGGSSSGGGASGRW